MSTLTPTLTSQDASSLLRSALTEAGLDQLGQPAGTVLVYVRLSLDEADDLHGCITQAIAQLRYCQTAGLTPVLDPATDLPCFLDNNLSASRYATKARPAFHRMLSHIRETGTRAVLVTHMDRLTRTPKELEAILDLAVESRQPLILHSLYGAPADLADGDVQLISRIGVSVAAHQSDATSRRIRMANERIRELGRWGSGKPPFGYRRGGEAGLEPDPQLAKHIRQAVRLLLSGSSMAEIARLWNEKAVPRAQAGAGGWSGGQIRDRISSPSLAGWMVHRGQIVGKGAWTPILTEEEHEALSHYLAENLRRWKGGAPRRRDAWTGLFVCSSCGHRLLRGTGSSRRGPYPVYQCSRIHGGCGQRSLRADHAKAAVAGWLVDKLATTGLEQLVARVDPAVLEAARAEVARLERKLAVVREQWMADEITDLEYRQDRRVLAGQQEEARRELIRQQTAALSYSGELPTTQAQWKRLTDSRKGRVLRLLIAEVRVDAGSSRFTPSRLEIWPTYGAPERLGSGESPEQHAP